MSEEAKKGRTGSPECVNVGCTYNSQTLHTYVTNITTDIVSLYCCIGVKAMDVHV